MLSKVLQYKPEARPTGLDACMHPFFDDLRDPDTQGIDSKTLPTYLFWFTTEELAIMKDRPDMDQKLIPPWEHMPQGGTWPVKYENSRPKPRPKELPSLKTNGPDDGSTSKGGEDKASLLEPKPPEEKRPSTSSSNPRRSGRERAKKDKDKQDEPPPVSNAEGEGTASGGGDAACAAVKSTSKNSTA